VLYPTKVERFKLFFARICVQVTTTAMQSHNIKLVYLFASFTIISIASASVFTWGFNSAGELGTGSQTIGQIFPSPTPINETAGIQHETITSICCAENFCIAACESGVLYSWGDNTVGQLGDGSGQNQAQPVRVKISEKMAAISCGQDHVLATGFTGKVYAWGWNYRGQVAASMDVNMVPTPQKIHFFEQKNIVVHQIVAGYQHSMALTDQGIVYTWGDNSMGQLGTGMNSEQPFSNVPTSVSGLPPISLIGAGEDQSFAQSITSNQIALYAWGDNSVGQLGTGSVSDRPNYLPIKSNITNMRGFGPITQIVGGAGHTLAILYNGDVFVWGSNTFGQLGLGDKIDRYNPTLLRLANQARIAHASGGLLHSLVVDENGNVWGFGGNSSGQCGDGDRQDLESPVQTSVSATYVAAGKFFSACAGN
jgi:alpha-tubulin suppressor-like RCC1 family protein